MAGIGQHQVKGFGLPVPPWDDNMGPVIVRGNDNAIAKQYDAHDNDASMHINNGQFAGSVTFNGSVAITGLLDISGAGAGQIKFPATQNPSSNPNTLDDYEEGTWSPTLTFSVSGSATYNASFTGGRYTKVGRLVAVQGIVVVATTTAPTGDVMIAGLPFTSSSGGTAYQSATVIAGGLSAAIISALMARLSPSSSSIELYKASAGGFTALQGADLGATPDMYISLHYTV